ncbi:MAG: AtpZ/AtpI family protein [Acidimicrobiales bacterium]
MDQAQRREQRKGLRQTLIGSRRQANEGFDDGLAKAFELAITPAIFAFFGWLLDRWIGTSPLFVVLLFAVVMAYEVWRLFVRYDADMRDHEAHLFGPGQDGQS